MNKTATPDLSVIVPCFNEQDNIAHLVARLNRAVSRAGLKVEIVLVDDGSVDRTWARITEAAGASSNVVPLHQSTNEGIVPAWKLGIREASAPYSCFFDADMQHTPRDIFTLYAKLLAAEADIVQGVRSMVGRKRDIRWAASRSLNRLLNVIFGHSSKDSKSGFLIGPTPVLEDVISHHLRYSFFQTFVSVSAFAKGYSILEVDCSFVERRAGRSFMAGRMISVSLRALMDFIPAIREFRGNIHPFQSSIGPEAFLPSVTRHPYQGWRRLLFETYFATMPLHKWIIRRSARRMYLELRASERSTRTDLDLLQTAKLRRLVLHAYNHVPLYRRRMAAHGLTPASVRTLEDVSRLPMLSKDDVRRNLYFDLFAVDHDEKGLHKITTSGSTGEPLTTYGDRYQLEMRFASTLRGLEWTGWRFGDKQARLWHQTIGMSKTQVIRERMDAWFMRRLFIPAFEISPVSIEPFVSRIRAHRPVLVDGYAESLNFLADYVKSGRSAGFSPRAIMSSAQALPLLTRETIEDGFDTRVFDKYGSREFSGIAYQCEASKDHHVMDESYIVEILVDGRPAEPGEVGEVVVTDLNNFSVPLIRYRIGDLATAVDSSKPCPCGRQLSRVGEIQGRTQAIVHCSDGTWIPGTFFAHFFKDYEATVRHFQVVQHEKGSFTLRIVLAEGAMQQDLEIVVDDLREFVGATNIEVEFVREIQLERTGKRSPVVSTVKEDFQKGFGTRMIGSLASDADEEEPAKAR